MHRHTIFLLLILSLIIGGVRVWAQTDPASQPIILPNPPTQMITASEEAQSLAHPSANLPDFDNPFAVNVMSDSCSAATTIIIGNGDQDTNVNALTQGATDPVLSCMWGTPSSSTGYRTGWYKFTATSSKVVTINTFGSSYDTVLAVWKDVSPDTLLDPCTDFANGMQLVSCVDDSRGLTSQATFTVRKGETYYIEVADWDAAAPTSKTLVLQTSGKSVVSNWSLESAMPTMLSRHATAVAGSSIYVIGGQKSQLGTVDITNEVRRYNTATDQWTTLQSMPGTGYSNTTAAFVDGPNDNGRIYLPSGYVGGAYDMTHWSYDIQTGVWLPRTAITDVFAGTQPFAWATAVADPNPSVNGYYVIGGLESTEILSSTAAIKNEMYLYKPDAGGGTWLSRASMNVQRYGHTGALVNGKVCVAGGISPGNVLEPTAECYTQAGGWTDIGEMANLNIPRYAAASAVGKDGRWYIIGGLSVDNDNNIYAVAETEVYDMTSNTWTILPANFELGDYASLSLPPRAWPRGGTVGSTYYAIGGNNTPDEIPLSLVQSIFLSTNKIFMPVVMSNYNDEDRPDDNFGQARRLLINVPQYRNFDTSSDYFDVYYFDLAAQAPITVRLSQIPTNSNYDLFVYDDNKFLWDKSDNVFNGVSEVVSRELLAGRYYVVVKRALLSPSSTSNYRIIVEK